MLGLGQGEAPFPMAALVRRAIRLRGQFAYSRPDFGRAVAILAEGDLRLDWLTDAPLSAGGGGLRRSGRPPRRVREGAAVAVMSEQAFLVTGRPRLYRCVGGARARQAGRASRHLSDLSTDPRRLALLLAPEQLELVPHVAGDISDLGAVERALDEHAITNVIHLAALQIPFCRADPPLGARVNVLGTVNVFEAVRRRLDRMAPIVYASSIAAFDAPDETAEPSMSGYPGTIYGVYKRANEGTAWVYLAESGVASVGLRPHTVYGVGRDQGLTSAPTTAMLAAAAGVPYTIPYGGAAQLGSLRRTSPARSSPGASRSASGDASVHNLPGLEREHPRGDRGDRAGGPGRVGRRRRHQAAVSRGHRLAESFAALVPGFTTTLHLMRACSRRSSAFARFSPTAGSHPRRARRFNEQLERA